MVERWPKLQGIEVVNYQLSLKIVEEEADISLFWLEFIVSLEFIHQPGKAVLAGKKLLKYLIE